MATADAGGGVGAGIVALDAAAAHRRIAELADILVDCVEGGASVSFMLPFDRAAATAYWQHVIGRVAAGATVLLVARDGAGPASGTVQLALDTPPNQPHRAEVAKLLVHRRARGRGLAAALVAALEAEARARGRTLLTLDTMTGSVAERLYARLGWTRAGIVPGYALFPAGGEPGATAIFWKRLPPG